MKLCSFAVLQPAAQSGAHATFSTRFLQMPVNVTPEASGVPPEQVGNQSLLSSWSWYSSGCPRTSRGHGIVVDTEEHHNSR